jgi:hypothetical protein
MTALKKLWCNLLSLSNQSPTQLSFCLLYNSTFDEKKSRLSMTTQLAGANKAHKQDLADSSSRLHLRAKLSGAEAGDFSAIRS